MNVIKFLVEYGAGVNVKCFAGGTALHYAADKGICFIHCSNEMTNIIQPLTPLLLIGQMKIVRFLIDNGADVNTKGLRGTTPLHSAAMHRNITEIIYPQTEIIF